MEHGSSPDTSRPSSPAPSDATEVPDSQRAPRTFADDIEHIKSLISHTDSIGRAAESSITAQLFRGRRSSTASAAPVSQQRVLHELDLLKKRIRSEQHHTRRPSQLDPETESESEGVDEREDELDSIREQMLHERRQSEDLLAIAERRIDLLIKEKEDLSQRLDTNDGALARLREELQGSKDAHATRLSIDQQENDSLRESLHIKDDLHLRQAKSAEERIVQMKQHVAKFEQRANAAEALMKHKEAEFHDLLTGKDRELADVQAHLAEMQQRVYEQSAELEGKNAELSEATEHAYRMYDESDKAYNASLREVKDKHAQEIGEYRATHSAELESVRSAHTSLQIELASAVEACAAAKAAWTEEVARLKVEHEQSLDELEKGWSSKAEEAARSHEAELTSARNDYQKELAALSADAAQRATDLSGTGAVGRTTNLNSELWSQLESSRKDFEAVKAKLVSAQQTNWNQLIQFQEKHKQAVASHAAEKGALEKEHRHKVEDLEAENSALDRQVNELKTLHRELSHPISPTDEDHPVGGTKALGFLKECTRQLQKVHAAEVERLRNGYDTSLRDLEESSTAELNAVRQALEEALEFSRAEGVVALDSVHRDQEESKRALEERIVAAENASKAQLADLDMQHQKVLQKLELSRQEDLESLRSEHERAVRMLLRNHKSELNSMEDTHQQQLSDLETALRAQKADTIPRSGLTRRHQEALERAIGEAHESSQAEIISLRKNHKRELSRVQSNAEKEMAAALAQADEDLEERLRVQSKAHRKELDKLNESLNVELTHLHLKLEEASQMREEKMQEAESQHRSALEELREKFEVAEHTMTALQARLDAEAIGRAEAERSLATLRRQRYSETPVESKATLRRSIIVLEAERDNLARQLAGSPASTYADAPEIPQEIPSPENEVGDATLKQRLATVERERDEAQSSAERKIDEMTRQTEFLVKELELVMAQRSAEQASYNPNVDASVQTEPVAVIDARTLQEPKADAAMSKVAKMQRPDLRRSVTDLAELPDKRRSFEDYLQQAQAELSNRGSATDENEILFAEKTYEFAAVLQAAKDQLATEYHRKFRALQTEKERMERAVSAKSAADFTREHEELFASYGINHEERSKQAAMLHNLPSRKKKAIRIGEQGLVAEYQRRLAKRKSQIAMKHAEKFQSLTKDFHQRAADLLNGKETAANGLTPVKAQREGGGDGDKGNPSQNGNDSTGRGKTNNAGMNHGTIDKVQLENALGAAFSTTRRSHLPKRISISVPRSATSIPRAVPFSGRTGWNMAPSSQRANPAGEALRLMLDENSLTPLRAGYDYVSPLSTVARTPDGFASDTNSSPGPREDALYQLASSASSPSSTSTKSRPRTMKHSSRMIFGVQDA